MGSVQTRVFMAAGEKKIYPCCDLSSEQLSML